MGLAAEGRAGGDLEGELLAGLHFDGLTTCLRVLPPPVGAWPPSGSSDERACRAAWRIHPDLRCHPIMEPGWHARVATP